MADEDHPKNTYYHHFERMAQAFERMAEGSGKPFRGRKFDFSTEDGFTYALKEVVRALGGEVLGA